MDNLELYNKIRTVPSEAQRKITGGRLNGMTDIKPMWRIEKLTEMFGICGIGWKTIITDKQIIDGANGEKIAVVDIELYIKQDGEWSEAIVGTGGSSFVANESKGLYTSDECFKMAYTDALSVACKSLGMGADVYWGDSKYNTNRITTQKEAEEYKLTFGKYAGKTLYEIEDLQHDYIEWLVKNSKDENVLTCIDLLYGMKKSDFEVSENKLSLTSEIMQLVSETDVDLEDIKASYGLDNLNEADEETLNKIKSRLIKTKELREKVSK